MKLKKLFEHLKSFDDNGGGDNDDNDINYSITEGVYAVHHYICFLREVTQVQCINNWKQTCTCIMSFFTQKFLALLSQYLCQRFTVLQEYCKMAKFLKYNKLATSVVKLHLNTSITRRYQTSVRLNNS
jgi:hypothetical protein